MQLRLIFKLNDLIGRLNRYQYENHYKQGKWCPSTRYRDDDEDKDQYDEDCLHLNIWVPLTAIKNKVRIYTVLESISYGQYHMCHII